MNEIHIALRTINATVIEARLISGTVLKGTISGKPFVWLKPQSKGIYLLVESGEGDAKKTEETFIRSESIESIKRTI